MSSPIENFAQTTTDFLDALALIPGNKRSIAPENEWSAAYVVHHVADAELHFAARYLHTLGSDNPTMVFFEEERYPEALFYAKRSVAKSLASIVGIRGMVLEALSEVADKDWNRITTATNGEVFSLAQLVEKANGHLRAHTDQLRALATSI
jgi:hypothetical protein